MKHWEREGLKQWDTRKGMYTENAKQMWLEGIVLATTDEVISRKLENEIPDEPISTADGIAICGKILKMDHNGTYLKNLYNKLNKESVVLTMEEFDSMPGKVYVKEDIENCTDIFRNPLWLELLRFQMDSFRKYHEAASKYSEKPLRIILPEGDKKPMLYPIKLGEMSTGSLLSMQYLDENSLVAGYKIKVRL